MVGWLALFLSCCWFVCLADCLVSWLVGVVVLMFIVVLMFVDGVVVSYVNYNILYDLFVLRAFLLMISHCAFILFVLFFA